MSDNPSRFGFRILGTLDGPRRIIDFGSAFAAYAACDARAEVEREAYLSAFQFDADFRAYLDERGTVRGFAGACSAQWIWFDVDRADDLSAAMVDTRTLATALVEVHGFERGEVLCFFSGAKGFHLGVRCLQSAGVNFNKVARRLAETLAAQAGYGGVLIDVSIYDKVRAFRAPNSRHPRSGLHKLRLSLDELDALTLDDVRARAQKPAPFEVPTPAASHPRFADAWRECEQSVAKEEAERRERASRPRSDGDAARLNRATLDFIRAGASEGDRHRLLFSAAANLAEFGCSSALAHALLTEAGLDTGLPPAEVRRQIECGLAHAAMIAEGGSDASA